MRELLVLCVLCSLGCGSADGSPPSPGEASPEPQHESSVVRCSSESEDFVAWQSDGLTHVSQKTGLGWAVIRHYDRETPFEAEFGDVRVLVSAELDVCVED